MLVNKGQTMRDGETITLWTCEADDVFYCQCGAIYSKKLKSCPVNHSG